MDWRELRGRLGIHRSPLVRRLGLPHRGPGGWPPYCEQEEPWSCAIACTRMVLASRGSVYSEAQLFHLYCQRIGTASAAVRLRGGTLLSVNADLAFELSAKTKPHTMWSAGGAPGVLVANLVVGVRPVINGRLRPPHAVLILAPEGGTVRIHDPARGAARLWSELGFENTFEAAWRLRDWRSWLLR